MKIKQVRKMLIKAVSWLFAVYMGYTFLSVICLERSLVIWKRSYSYSNLLPVIGVIIALIMFYRMTDLKAIERFEKISDKSFYTTLAIVSAIVLLVQLICMRYIAKPLGTDFKTVRDTAGSIGLHYTFINDSYFNKYPNNQGITFLFAMMMRVFRRWTVVIAAGVLAINLSILLTAQIIYCLSGKKTISVMAFVVGTLLFSFSYRTFVPYTDNYGVFFMVLPLAIALNKKKGIIWSCIGAGSMALACFIKITAAIPILAYVCFVMIYGISNNRKKISQMILVVISFFVVFCTLTICKDICFQNVGFKQDEQRGVGIWHYFMMGQNEAKLGSVFGDDIEYSMSFETEEERSEANRIEGIRRIKERGIKENLTFFTYKNFQNYGDGGFSPVQRTIRGEEYGDSLIEKVFIGGKQYYIYYSFVQQTLWILVLFLIICQAVIDIKDVKDNGIYLFLKILILGVSAYVLIFESRAKYLYMFVPFYLILSAEGMKGLFNKIRSLN